MLYGYRCAHVSRAGSRQEQGLSQEASCYWKLSSRLKTPSLHLFYSELCEETDSHGQAGESSLNDSGATARATNSSIENRNMQRPYVQTVLVLRMAHRKWKEIKQQPGMLPGPAVPGCCLVSFHILWAILSTSTVVRGPKFTQTIFGQALTFKSKLHNDRGLRLYISNVYGLCSLINNHDFGHLPRDIGKNTFLRLKNN